MASIKCLEFLYFYLLPEEGPYLSCAIDALLCPNHARCFVGSTLRHKRGLLPQQATSNTPAHTSTTLGSSAPKLTSAEAIPAISDIKHRDIPFSTPLTSPAKTGRPRPPRLQDPKTPLSNRHYKDAANPRSFPNSPTKRSTSHAHSLETSDHLAMLHPDLEYVPLSPQKKQVATLGVGRPKPPSSMEGRDTSDRASGTRRISPAVAPSASTGTPSTKRISRRVTPTLDAEEGRRKTSFPEPRSSVFDTPQHSSPMSNRGRIEPRALRRAPSQPHSFLNKSGSSPTKSGISSPTKSLFSPTKSKTSSPAKSIIHDGRSETRTTEEKKALLSTWLGNVDALVEGVQRAGVWGLE